MGIGIVMDPEHFLAGLRGRAFAQRRKILHFARDPGFNEFFADLLHFRMVRRKIEHQHNLSWVWVVSFFSPGLERGQKPLRHWALNSRGRVRFSFVRAWSVPLNFEKKGGNKMRKGATPQSRASQPMNLTTKQTSFRAATSQWGPSPGVIAPRCLNSEWRREGDSNSRWGISPLTLSRRAL